VIHQLHQDPHWTDISQFVRGGYWRNFRVKYEEANEMYCRMLEVSRRLMEAQQTAADPALLPQAEDHLYRGQCNCPYWHGAFGGIYLPHLRNATYRELIAADSLIEQALGRDSQWIDATTEDYNHDLKPEVRLSNDQLVAYIAPARGGMIYELDVRAIQHNLLATMQRQPEVYHRKVMTGSSENHDSAASIHDRVVFKQEGLQNRLFYDRFPRKSMLDHFYDLDTTLDSVVRTEATERGDFVAMPFQAKLRRGAGKVQAQLRRDGNAWGVPIALTKAVTLMAGQNRLQVTYLLEGLPPGRPFHFAMEWNFAGMPAGADDRFFFDSNGQSLGQLGTHLDLQGANYLGLIDQWLGVSVQLALNRPSGF
jgi:alpha-amylase